MAHFSQTYAFFPNLSIIFVCFLYLFFDMKKLSEILTVLAVAAVMSWHPASAQSRNDSNVIVSAVSEYNQGHYENAEAMLSICVEDYPDNDAAWYYLGLCHFALQDADMAEHCLSRAAELDPSNFWYRYRLAGLYAMTGRGELTVGMYEKLLEDFPKKSELYYDLVEMYSAKGENQKALDTLNEIETVFGMTESIAMYRFNLLMRMDRKEEAYRSLEEYNSRYSSPFVLVTLAEYELSTYNDSTALAYYNEALDLAPDYSPALLGKAETFRMTRRYDDYFTILEKYVSNPNDRAKSKTDYLMAVVQGTSPDFLKTFSSRMDKVVDATLEVHPLDSGALRMAGAYYYTTGRKEVAKQHFMTNAKANPTSLVASIDLVEYLMYSGDWVDLSVEGRKAYMRFPQETAFLEMASVGDYNLGDYESVLDVCREIVVLAPTDSSKTLRAWSTMGDVYHALGDSKNAFKAYEKALDVNPDYVYVLNNYAYFLSQKGGKSKLKKAYKMSRKTIEAEPDNATYLDTFGWILYLMGKPEEAKPHFKKAMLYGGKDSVVIMDHYAEVLYALGEYDRAFVYWNNVRLKNNGEIPDLDEKIRKRKDAIKK